MCRACPASASRPQRSSSSNMAIWKRCCLRAGEIKQDKRRADADRQCGNRAHFQAAGHARPERQARGAGRRPRRARAGLQEPHRVPQGDGIQHADAAGRREIRHRRQRDRGGRQARRRERAAAAPPASTARAGGRSLRQERRPVRAAAAAARQGGSRRHARHRHVGGFASCRRQGQQDRPQQIRDGAHARPAESLGAARQGRRRGRDRHRDHQPRPDAPRSCAASRSRSATTRPATCRSVTATATRKGGKDLFAPEAKLRRTRFRRRPRWRRSSRCWKTRACSRSARTSNSTGRFSARRGIDDSPCRRHHADVLRARRRRAAATAWTSLPSDGSAIRPIHFEQVAGSGKAQVHVRLRVDREGRRIRRRGRRRHAAAVERAEGAARRRACRRRSTRRWSGRWCRCWRRMERRGISIDRQVLSRLSGEFAQKQAGLEDEISKLAGAAAQSRQPEATGRRAVRQDGPAGRHQDQDRAMGDRRARAGRAGRAGPRAAAENSRLAAGVQAALDLHRRTAGLRQRRDPPRPHLLRAGRDHDRPAVVIRAEPAEHPGPHRGGPQDPPRLHRRRRAPSWSPPTIRRSSCGCSPRSPKCRRCARRSATASTSTP